jgi:hypothetical protein
VWLRHAEEGSQVVIEYYGKGDGRVLGVVGASSLLPAAPEGNTVTLNVPPGVEQLNFLASPELRVTRLVLQTSGQ